jgi:hypothetical protein
MGRPQSTDGRMGVKKSRKHMACKHGRNNIGMLGVHKVGKNQTFFAAIAAMRHVISALLDIPFPEHVHGVLWCM